MLFEDTYKTITRPSEGLFKDRGSKFIARAYPVLSEDEVKQRLEELRKEFHDARHHCYAYQLGVDKSAYRINDDGEPSGTAGRPIFGQILSFDLTNVLIVVVRYFGGTKLGVSGLINAYKTASKEALEASNIITKTINEIYLVKFKYPEMNEVMRILKENNLTPFDQKFELDCELKFSVRKLKANEIYEKYSHLRSINIKYVKTE